MKETVVIRVKDSEGNEIKQYEVTLKYGETRCELFDEARSVWDEYLIEMHCPGSILASNMTWKQELMERQYMLDLHDEVAGEE